MVGLASMLGHNLYWLVRNQVQRGCNEKLCVSPSELETVAWRASNPKISKLALYYLLARRIPHATLTIPPAWRRERADLEDIARVRALVGKTTLLVAATHVDRLSGLGITRQRRLRVDGVRRGPTEQRGREPETYVFLFDETATDYVVAETEDEKGPIFVMPRSVHAEVAPR